jgi:hypothetical protein
MEHLGPYHEVTIESLLSLWATAYQRNDSALSREIWDKIVKMGKPEEEKLKSLRLELNPQNPSNLTGEEFP